MVLGYPNSNNPRTPPYGDGSKPWYLVNPKMDVHPTKNVSIGIDPYPYFFCPRESNPPKSLGPRSEGNPGASNAASVKSMARFVGWGFQKQPWFIN